MRNISIVIPCYRSEKTIKEVVCEIVDTIKSDDLYEIILVNDGSPDNVWNEILKLSKKNNHVKGICLSKNFGQHAAMMAGYAHCSGDYIVTLDDDGQTPANEMYKLIDTIEKGYDVVFAEYGEKHHNIIRNFESKINVIMSQYLVGVPKGIIVNSFYCMRKFVAEEMLQYTNPYPYIAGLIFRITKNASNTAVMHRNRVSGSSGYTFGKLFSLWINGFTAFSIKPLRIATITGVCCAGAGFVYGCITIIRKLLNPMIASGWSSLISVNLFVGGVTMLMLGMVGEYIGRIYISINNSPQYVIKEIVEKK